MMCPIGIRDDDRRYDSVRWTYLVAGDKPDGHVACITAIKYRYVALAGGADRRCHGGCTGSAQTSPYPILDEDRPWIATAGNR